MKLNKQKLKKIWEDHFYPNKKLKDCISSSALERRNNYLYNQENKNFMISPILSWCLISVYNLLIIALIEGLIDKTYFKNLDLSKYAFSLQCSLVTLSLIFTISFVIMCVFTASYLYLCFVHEE
jgi:magnesium-transporting ATPase (P-type)